jgi:hypothetical protein
MDYSSEECGEVFYWKNGKLLDTDVKEKDFIYIKKKRKIIF